MSHLRRHQEAAHKSVPNSRIVQRLVKDATGNLVKKPKPTKEKKAVKDKKEAQSRSDISETQEQYADDTVSPMQHEDTRVQLMTVNEEDQVVAMTVPDLPIADQHVDPYSLQVIDKNHYISIPRGLQLLPKVYNDFKSLFTYFFGYYNIFFF